jgi:hypothetical protein
MLAAMCLAARNYFMQLVAQVRRFSARAGIISLARHDVGCKRMINITSPQQFKTVPWKNSKRKTIELTLNDEVR